MALKFANNNSLSAITSTPSGVGGGSLNLISTQTASSSSTISFTSGIDSTYKEYIFKFYDIHPSLDGGNADFQFNMSIDSGSNYNVTKTTTGFYAYHNEAGSSAGTDYEASYDLAQGTGFQFLGADIGNDNDQCLAGTLHLFNPSSTTFVKHFIFVGNRCVSSDLTANDYFAGYGNTTSAVDAIQFKMAGGTIDSGVIKLYGVS